MDSNCKQVLGISLFIFLALFALNVFSNEKATDIDGSVLPTYHDASEFVKTNAPSEVIDDTNFIYTSQQIEYPHVSRSSKVKYYDLRAPPVIPKDDLYFNDSPYEVPPGMGRKSIDI